MTEQISNRRRAVRLDTQSKATRRRRRFTLSRCGPLATDDFSFCRASRFRLPQQRRRGARTPIAYRLASERYMFKNTTATFLGDRRRLASTRRRRR